MTSWQLVGLFRVLLQRYCGLFPVLYFCPRAGYYKRPNGPQRNATMSSAQPKPRRARLIAINPDKPQARPSDWEGVRGLITQLYVDEDRTLKETMTIMSREHGHNAT